MSFLLRTKTKYEVTSLTDTLLSKLDKFINTPAFFKDWYDNGAWSDSMWDDYVVEKNEDGEVDEELTKEKAQEVFDDTWDTFYHAVDDASVLWRCLGTNNPSKFSKLAAQGKYEKGYEGLGIYWAFDRSRAECHWGEGADSITLEAKVTLNAIDIKRTAHAIMNLSTGPDEAEITLKEGASITLVQIHSDDDELLTKPVKVKA